MESQKRQTRGRNRETSDQAITEKSLTVDIRRLLRKHGGYFVKFWGGPMSKAGVADLLGVYRGRPVAIEVKRPTGKVTRDQERSSVPGATLAGSLYR
jgi:hypothetical protein